VVASKNDVYSDDDIRIWEILFTKVRDSIVSPCKIQEYDTQNTGIYRLIRPIDKLPYLDRNVPAQEPSVIQVKRYNGVGVGVGVGVPPRIVITFTTCKRFDLFQQTVNSILNMWSDVDKIDHWLCVDDNSSPEDRVKMRDAYPWIEYIMKSPAEKGHRPSMKIIWKKLNELRPEYWIHMEDDFLFHTPGSYVYKAIQMMTDARNSGYNVRQILYNRNYGETVRDYKIQGHKLIRRMKYEMALHQHKTSNDNGGNDFGYGNCHYWPHYSFRPSLIDVSAILAVGDYDTPNQFFEMDYANRWTRIGFLSGFFNQITNRHIGRLTSERNDRTQPNAYELNDESQFTAPATAVATDATDATATDATVATATTSPKKQYYSTIQFTDGFGAQFQRFIWTCIYAEECERATFVYRTPDKIAHNYDNDPQFIDTLEALMNMKPNYLNYNDVIRKNAEHEHAGRRDDIIEILTPDFYDIFNYIERNIDKCMKSQSMNRIKENFWANKDRNRERERLFQIPNPKTMTDDTPHYTHHLSIHIRRPNCDDTRPNGGEEYNNAYYIQSIMKIVETYTKYDINHRLRIHVYSQGEIDKFSEFVSHPGFGKDVLLHLNEKNEDTYLGMTLADILITSASSYSYSAAFFCEGDIYYTEFWHKPCSWWNRL
jgi:hypothetical protein